MRTRRNRGFTFLEVLIATAIFLVLLGIGVPRLNRIRGPYLVAGGSRQVAAALQAARMRAIARNASYRINFDVANGTYILQRFAGGAWVNDGATQRLPVGTSFGAINPDNPVFDSRGMAAAQVTIPVTRTGSTTRTVTLNVLGRTTIS